MNIDELKERIKEYFPNDHIIFYSTVVGTRKTYIEFSHGTKFAIAVSMNGGHFIKFYDMKEGHTL